MEQKKRLHRASIGGALMVVLLLTLVMSVITMASLESGLLQMRMAHNHQSKILHFQAAENMLEKIEQQVYDSDLNLPLTLPVGAQVTHQQFVPDTLHFGEENGLHYYEVTLQETSPQGAHVVLKTTIAKRAQYNPIVVFFSRLSDGAINDDTEYELSVKMANQKWAVISLKENHVHIREKQSGHKMADIDIPLMQGSLGVQDMPMDKKALTALVVVDTKNVGIADRLYVSDAFGRLWKIDMESPFPSQWKIALGTREKPLPLFCVKSLEKTGGTKIEGTKIEGTAGGGKTGKILSTPLVGASAKGAGVFIYMVVGLSDNTQQMIYALEDKPDQKMPLSHPKWSFGSDNMLGGLLLRNGYLLITERSEQENVPWKITVLKQADGNIVRQVTTTVVRKLNNFEGGVAKECDFANKVQNKSITQPNDIFIIDTQGTQTIIRHSTVKIDGHLLGRQTWQEIYR